jgi:hypothetical protein
MNTPTPRERNTVPDNQLARHAGGAQVLRLSDNRASITGTLAEVGPVLDALRRAGRLVAASDPLPNGVPGQVLVNVRLVPPVMRMPPQSAAPRLRWSRRAVAMVLAAAAVVVSALGWMAYLALTWVITHVAMVLAVLGIIILVGATAGPRACKIVVTITHRH